MMKSYAAHPALVLVFCLWAGSITTTYVWMMGYNFTPGTISKADSSAPSFLASRLTERGRLVLALHPHCPCSRATVQELARTLRYAPDGPGVTVLMFKPAAESDAWLEGTLKDECERWGWELVPDPDGRSAASLGSVTSGTVLYYAPDGTLRFQGGVTAARGHEGDNAGKDELRRILAGEGGGVRLGSVYGCPIRGELPAEGRTL